MINGSEGIQSGGRIGSRSLQLPSVSESKEAHLVTPPVHHQFQKAKVSLEVREVVNASDEEVNDPNSKDFIRFMSAKQGNDATTIYVHDHSLRRTKVNETRSVPALLLFSRLLTVHTVCVIYEPVESFSSPLNRTRSFSIVHRARG